MASARERMAVAVAEICAEQGYAAATGEQVVARSGVQAAAFPENFVDIEACAKAAVDAILAEVMATVGSNYSPDRSERDSYLLAIRAILELLAAKPSFAHVSFICARQMAPSEVGESLETGARLLSAMLERLREDSGSELPPPPSRAARAALGGAEAVVRREIAGRRAEALPRLLPDFVYAATVPFLGQEEALRLARRGRELLSEAGQG